jgi:hypothetical protein
MLRLRSSERFGAGVGSSASPAFRQDVAHIQKGVALQPDVHERRVHARQHILHQAFVDVADDALAPLEAQLHQLPILQDGDSRLAG